MASMLASGECELLMEDSPLEAAPDRLITLVEAESGGGAVFVGASSGRLQSSSVVLELGRKLLHAAREGDTAGVLALMSKGAPFTTDWLGTSPLHLAAMNAHMETCRVLLRAGISRDTRTKVERTPLHLAAYEGHVDVCVLLLAYGARCDARDMLQMTPLHWAVERGHAECVRVLLESGADPNAVSKFRKTPLSMAEAGGDESLLALLHEALLAGMNRESEQPLQQNDVPSEPEPVAEEQAEEVAGEEEDEAAGEEAGEAEAESVQRALADMLPSNQQTPTQSADAAALLRQHGITLLPTDNNNTLLSALRSGRTVVLSDAGKLMLKESSGGVAAGDNPLPEPAKPPRPKLPANTKITRIFTINGNQLVSVPRVRRVLPLTSPTVAQPPGDAKPRTSIKVSGGTGTVLTLQQLRALQADGTGVVRLRTSDPSTDAASVTVKRLLPGGGAPAERLRAELAGARAALAEREREVRALRRRLLLYESPERTAAALQ